MKRCIDCEIEKSLEYFNKLNRGFRPECKDCEKARREARHKADPLLATVNTLADGILKRVKYGINKPKNKIYKERGIKCLIGENRAEIRESLLAHFEEDIKNLLEKGERPSVDRIDAYSHYTIENIQIISVKENASRADASSKSIPITAVLATGEKVSFISISEAAKSLEIKRDTITRHLTAGTKTRYGISFFREISC